jgi:hypothetical protein
MSIDCSDRARKVADKIGQRNAQDVNSLRQVSVPVCSVILTGAEPCGGRRVKVGLLRVGAC